jgi:hypothetical protein
MDAQAEAPTAAQQAVDRAMLLLLFPRATPADLLRLSSPPPWICTALEELNGFVGDLLRCQRDAPRRAELAAQLAPAQAYVESLPPMISGPLRGQLGIRPLLDRLAQGGGFRMLGVLGYPSPKLLIACAVVALHVAYRDHVPSEKNPLVRALCAAILVRAAEAAGLPVPEKPDARRTQWGHPLRQACASVMASQHDDRVLSTAWGLVRTALQPIADQASFNPAPKC